MRRDKVGVAVAVEVAGDNKVRRGAVKRRVLDDARERRLKAHLKEQKARITAVNTIAAGPSGVVEYLPGGKVKPQPDRGVRAGRDDFKTASTWERA